MVANLKSREGAAASAARMLIAGISLLGAAALSVGLYCLRSLAPPPATKAAGAERGPFARAARPR